MALQPTASFALGEVDLASVESSDRGGICAASAHLRSSGSARRSTPMSSPAERAARVRTLAAHRRSSRAGLLLAERLAHKEKVMTKSISRISIAIALNLAGACGSMDHGQTTDPTCVSAADARCRITPTETSFVRWTGPVTDGIAGGVSTAVVEYSRGRFCMSGTVDSGPGGSGWGAILLLGLGVADATGTMITPLDVSARGITQVRFTVEDPPLTGILPQMAELENAACTTVPDCLVTFDAPPSVIDPGPVTMALTDFARPDDGHPNTTLDPTLISWIQLYVAPLPGMALPYDFCIREFAFLDASGREVTP
jgi:hypothetical protein